MHSPDLRRRTSSLTSRSKINRAHSNMDRAFYQLPERKQTPAEIIKESRNWLQTVSTRRPHTPSTGKRTLFGPNTKLAHPRSPSAKFLSTMRAEFNDASSGVSDEYQGQQFPDPTIATSKRKSVSCEPKLKTSSTTPNLQANQFTGQHKPNHSAGPTIHAKPFLEPPLLELRGTQSKLLNPTRARLISPVLNASKLLSKAGPLKVIHQEDGDCRTTGRTGFTTRKPDEISPYKSDVTSVVDKHVTRDSPHRNIIPSQEKFYEDKPCSPPRQNSPVETLGSAEWNKNFDEEFDGISNDKISSSTTARPTSSVVSSMCSTQNKLDERSEMASRNEADYLVSRIIDISVKQCDANLSEMEITVEHDTKEPWRSDEKSQLNEEVEFEVIGLTRRLYDLLKDEETHRERNWPNRVNLLKTLYRLLERCTPRAQLAVIMLILTLEVTGMNLNNVCKVLYNITKETRNDALYTEAPESLEIILTTVQSVTGYISRNAASSSTEEPLQTNVNSLLFLTGTLKFLCSSPTVGPFVNGSANLWEMLFSIHRCMINVLRRKRCQSEQLIAVKKELNTQICGVLIQVTEIFCHLAAILPEFRKWFIQPNDGALRHILDCLFHAKQDLSATNLSAMMHFNWIRLLSNLSESVDVCHRLEQLFVGESYPLDGKVSRSSGSPMRMDTFCQLMFEFLESYWESKELLIRLAYLLGNLTARLETAREALIPDSATLVKLCQLCENVREECAKREAISKNAVELNENNSAESAIATSNSDVLEDQSIELLNKLIRVLANSTISERVGRLAIQHTECIELYLVLIAHHDPSESGELLHNCLAGLNNLTYYVDGETGAEVVEKQYDVAEALMNLLSSGSCSFEVHLGCIRVLGNLSRSAPLRDWLMQNRNTMADSRATESPLIGLLLESLDPAKPLLVYSALGVLVNMLADAANRPILAKLGGLEKLCQTIRDFAGYDWQLVGLACKTLWNYTESSRNHCGSNMSVEITNELYALLSELIDEELVDRLHTGILTNHESIDETETIDLSKAAWFSEFLPVAKDLLSRLAND